MSGQNGQYSFSWTYALDFAQGSSLSLLDTGAVTSLGRGLPRLQIPCQRESWPDDSTLSAMPIHVLAQGYCTTVFDAITLGSESKRPCVSGLGVPVLYSWQATLEKLKLVRMGFDSGERMG